MPESRVNLAGMFRTLLLIGLLWNTLPTHTQAAEYTAESLRASHARLQEKLQNNPFGRPLNLDSVEKPDLLQGDIHALLDHKFPIVNATLNDPSGKPLHWCEVLSLHLNVKYCHSQDNGLEMFIGRKIDQPLEDAYPTQFHYHVITSSREHFAVELKADEGPLGTHDYRIVLEAIPVGDKTLMHLTYSYGYGRSGKLLMQSYLATLGRNKVGFTRTGTLPSGEPDYVHGMRSVLERNAMRYYLTVDAYLKSLSAPPAQRFEKSLEYWFDATEQYARQLHEIERQDYIDMKQHERQRQLEKDNR